MSLPKEASGYRVKIGGDVVDVTNFVEVAAAMNRELNKQRGAEIVKRNPSRGIPY